MSERDQFLQLFRKMHPTTCAAIEQAAIHAERERCAKIAEERIQCNDLCEQCETAKSIAAAIRRGGEHEHNE